MAGAGLRLALVVWRWRAPVVRRGVSLSIPLMLLWVAVSVLGWRRDERLVAVAVRVELVGGRGGGHAGQVGVLLLVVESVRDEPDEEGCDAQEDEPALKS